MVSTAGRLSEYYTVCTTYYSHNVAVCAFNKQWFIGFLIECSRQWPPLWELHSFSGRSLDRNSLFVLKVHPVRLYQSFEVCREYHWPFHFQILQKQQYASLGHMVLNLSLQSCCFNTTETYAVSLLEEIILLVWLKFKILKTNFLNETF